ncbi:hypothetical protein J6590_098698, partial [Homalodisca vitripennis]
LAICLLTIAMLIRLHLSYLPDQPSTSNGKRARLIPDKHLDTSRSHLETNDSDSDDPEIDQRRPTHTPRPRIPNQCRQVLSDNSDIDDNDEDSNDEGSIWEKVTT